LHEGLVTRTRPGVEHHPVLPWLDPDVVGLFEIFARTQHHAAALRTGFVTDVDLDLNPAVHLAERFGAECSGRGEFQRAACGGLSEGGVHGARHTHAQRAVGGLPEFMHDEIAAPVPIPVVLVLVAGGEPSEQVAAPAVAGGLGGVIGATVESVVGRREPGAFEAVRHAVPRLHALGKLAENEIPPVAHFEQIGTFVCEIEAGRPEWVADGPVDQVLGR